MAAVSDKTIDRVLNKLVPVAAVAAEVGCDRSHLTRLLAAKKLEGRKIGVAWFVPRSAIPGLRASLSSRSKGKRHLARRPAAGR